MASTPKVFAIAAHPDDIEFGMAGTLILLRQAGYELHYMNIADGCCGSVNTDAPATAAIRLEEARRAASRLGSVFHPPLAHDLEVFFEKSLLARLASIMREVAPNILLTPSPNDYMEDHMNACRLAVTAAFCRSMPNFPVDPPRPPVTSDVVVYHAQPYGNRDALNHLVWPDLCIGLDAVIKEKATVLAEHKSQKEWLDHSQGLGSYLETMREHAREIGQLSGKYFHAEGWRRHNPLGLCGPGMDPLMQLLDTAVECSDLEGFEE